MVLSAVDVSRLMIVSEGAFFSGFARLQKRRKQDPCRGLPEAFRHNSTIAEMFTSAGVSVLLAYSVGLIRSVINVHTVRIGRDTVGAIRWMAIR